MNHQQLFSQPYCILDTETTGLWESAEVVDIAIIDQDGAILLNSLVKPTKAISSDASRIHGITDQKVADAPSWKDVRPLAIEAMKGRNVIIYNADYDMRVIRQTDALSKTYDTFSEVGGCFGCAMQMFAQWYGEWNSYHDDYKWQKLETAFRVATKARSSSAYTALGDCLSTLAVVNFLATQLGADGYIISEGRLQNR